jgi:hypothetical protein
LGPWLAVPVASFLPRRRGVPELVACSSVRFNAAAG